MKRKHLINSLVLLIVFLVAEMNMLAEARLEHKPEDIEVSNILTHEKIVVTQNPDEESYNSIQKAIDNAPTGSTIYVERGTYNEILNINKKIHLIGEDRENTLLNPTSKKNSYAIRITAEGVELNGFSITNQGPGLYTTGVKISATQTTIEDCTILDTPVGIAIWSSKNTISNCKFRGCEDEGIAFLGNSLSGCNNNTVTNCEFYDNCDGIELQHASDNIISNCEFYSNTHAGIDAIGSSNNNNLISNCDIYNNGAFGIYLSKSSGNTISECSISENKIMATGSTDNIINNCKLDTIYLIDDSSLTIEDCNNLDESNIKITNSRYEINNDESEEENHLESNNKKEILRNAIINRIRSILSFWNTIRLRFRS